MVRMVGGDRLTKGCCGVQRAGDEVGSGEGPLPGVPARDRRPTGAGQARKQPYSGGLPGPSERRHGAIASSFRVSLE